jgi:MarR family transcriptional regulator for hemolysin
MHEARQSQQRAFALAVLRLARVYRRGIDRELSRHGLSDARALPVLHLARLGAVRQGVLADALGVEGPSLVRLLDQLCASGLVERRDDPSDGRAKILHLTEDGRALAGVIAPAVDRLRSELLTEVSDEDLAAALRVFSAFERALEAAQTRPPRAADA